MTVKIRLEALTAGELDEHETALREVLAIPGAASRDYPNRRRSEGAGQAGYRRYLESTGVGSAPPQCLPSPRAVAERAKARRDLGGELAALTAADADLEAQPWAPLRAGDVVLSHMPADGEVPAIGETYVAVDDGIDIAGHAMVRLVSASYRDPYGLGGDVTAFYDLWFEASPGSLTIIRAGAVIHGTPIKVPATSEVREADAAAW